MAASKSCGMKSTTVRSLTPLAVKMAARSQEVRPVGAWVQVADCYDDAVNSALAEETRVSMLQQQKEEKLRQFQEDVKQRVMAISKMKRQQQLDRTQQALNVEHRILSQSGQKATSRKDHCSIRRGDELIISNQPASTGVMLHGSADKNQVPAFEQHTNQIHRLSGMARSSLASRQLITNQYQSDDLPGGIWRHTAYHDHPVSRKQNGEVLTSSVEASDHDIFDKDNVDVIQRQTVRFDIDEPQTLTREGRIAQKTMNVICGTDVDRAPVVPVLRPSVETEQERVRVRQQLALYRRLFMDIEREQVKENIRQRNHRIKMSSVKKQKELERNHIEDCLQQQVPDVVSRLTLEQNQSIESVEHELSLQACQAAELRQRKQRETERFLEALKTNLRNKIAKQNLEVPQLCACAPTLWDTNPETCANNCIFYRNPKGYARALQSVLASCDVN